MLILPRKPGDQIIIGDEIEVHVLETRPTCAILGVQAPQDVPIYRHEIYDKYRKTRTVFSRDLEKVMAHFFHQEVSGLLPDVLDPKTRNVLFSKIIQRTRQELTLLGAREA